MHGAAMSLASFAQKANAARDAMVAGDRDSLVNAAVAMCRYGLVKDRFIAMSNNDMQAANDAAHEMMTACQANAFDTESDSAIQAIALQPLEM